MYIIPLYQYKNKLRYVLNTKTCTNIQIITNLVLISASMVSRCSASLAFWNPYKEGLRRTLIQHENFGVILNHIMALMFLCTHIFTYKRENKKELYKHTITYMLIRV